MALLFCVAAGANVYVNSSDDAKILKAIELGAKGGVNYKAGTVPPTCLYICLCFISNRCDYLSPLTLLSSNSLTSTIDKWDSQLKSLTHGEPFDVVIDGAGGDGFKAFTYLLRMGGIIVSYGMTVKPEVDYNMHAVLRNIEARGSTMVSPCFMEQSTRSSAKQA